jgi:hypothetical protein
MGEKWLGTEADRSFPSSAKVKSERSTRKTYLTLPYIPQKSKIGFSLYLCVMYLLLPVYFVQNILISCLFFLLWTFSK